MLQVASIVTYHGEVQALKGVSIHVNSGEIVALIGSNGAGKSTVLSTICGLTPPRQGRITFEGQEITGLTPERIVRLGMSYVPEGRQLFGSMSVRDNLLLGSYHRGLSRREFHAELDEVLAIFPSVADHLDRPAASLSGGEQQMVAIGRGLMAKPRLLLLDEPSIGLAPMLVKEIFSVIARFRGDGGTILLVEQNSRAALSIADRGYVLETGKVVLESNAQDLLENREVQRAYLGKSRKQIWE